MLSEILKPPAPDWLPWAILLVLLLVLAVLAVVLWGLATRRGKKKEAAAPAQAEGEAPAALFANPDEHWVASEMRRQVRGGLRTLAELTGLDGDMHDIPWILAVGGEDAGTWSMVEAVEPGRGGSGVVPRVGSLRFCRNGVVFHAGDDLVAGAAGMRRWSRLLRLLRTFRLDRPVDGVVIAVPVSILAGPDAIPPDRLADLGARYHDLIAEVQTVTGLRVPVVVVLTRGERISGFGALAGALPPKVREKALGWSVPYALETAYQPEWSDEALDAVATGLSDVTVQLLLGAGRLADPDDVTLLPARLRDLGPGLRALLAAMFQPSAYCEAFLFRGLYLTGAAPEGGMAFAAGLFAEKVFREYRLVRPVRGLITARNRRVRSLQIALAVLLALEVSALAGARLDTRRRVASVLPVIADIEASLSDLNTGRGEMDHGYAQEVTARLLQRMAGIDVLTVASPFAPLSYLMRPDKVVAGAISAGYNGIVMGQIYAQLSERLKGILTAPADQSKDPARSIEDLVDHLGEFNGYYNDYLQLSTLRDLNELVSLVRYALGIDLPARFSQDARLYEMALADATAKPIPAVAETVEKGLRDRFADAYAARFDERGLEQRLKGLSDLLKGGESRDPEAAMTRLVTLHRDIERVIQELDSPEFGWINGSGASLGKSFDTSLLKIEKMSLAGPAVAQTLRDQGIQRQTEARQRLFSLLTGGNRVPLLQIANGRVVLAPSVLTANQQLTALLNRSFMSAAFMAAPDLPSGMKSVVWDAPTLKTAQSLVDDYLSFIAGDALHIPEDLSFTVEMAAFDQVGQRAGAAMAAAARPGDRVLAGDYLSQGEMQALASSAPTLGALDERLRQAKLDSLASRLERTVRTQAVRLLTGLDAQVAGLPILQAHKDFSWWDGTTPLAERTFGTSDVASLVQANRSALANLARSDVGPLLQILGALPGDGRMPEAVARWQAIAHALALYDQGGGSLKQLEEFILTDMDRIDPKTCASLASGPVAAVQDPFSYRLAEMKAGIARQCADLSGRKVLASYQDLRQRFNATLAGRFPFSTSARIGTPQADPVAVRSFFWRLAQAKGVSPTAVQAASAGVTGAAASNFVADLADDATALAPMLADPTLPQPLIYDVSAEFRVDAEADVAGNQVIEWGVDLGDGQRLVSGGGKPSAVWTMGQPVRIWVRFARNGPARPAVDPAGGYRVDGMVASFEASDPWALLSLLARLSPDPVRLSQLPDQRPELVRLPIRLERNPDALPGAGAPDPMAELFLRLHLATVVRIPGKPEERRALTLPVFPAAAPDLSPQEGGDAPAVPASLE